MRNLTRSPIEDGEIADDFEGAVDLDTNRDNYEHLNMDIETDSEGATKEDTNNKKKKDVEIDDADALRQLLLSQVNRKKILMSTPSTGSRDATEFREPLHSKLEVRTSGDRRSISPKQPKTNGDVVDDSTSPWTAMPPSVLGVANEVLEEGEVVNDSYLREMYVLQRKCAKIRNRCASAQNRRKNFVKALQDCDSQIDQAQHELQRISDAIIALLKKSSESKSGRLRELERRRRRSFSVDNNDEVLESVESTPKQSGSGRKAPDPVTKSSQSALQNHVTKKRRVKKLVNQLSPHKKHSPAGAKALLAKRKNEILEEKLRELEEELAASSSSIPSAASRPASALQLDSAVNTAEEEVAVTETDHTKVENISVELPSSLSAREEEEDYKRDIRSLTLTFSAAEYADPIASLTPVASSSTPTASRDTSSNGLSTRQRRRLKKKKKMGVFTAYVPETSSFGVANADFSVVEHIQESVEVNSVAVPMDEVSIPPAESGNDAERKEVEILSRIFLRRTQAQMMVDGHSDQKGLMSCPPTFSITANSVMSVPHVNLSEPSVNSSAAPVTLTASVVKLCTPTTPVASTSTSASPDMTTFTATAKLPSPSDISKMCAADKESLQAALGFWKTRKRINLEARRKEESTKESKKVTNKDIKKQIKKDEGTESVATPVTNESSAKRKREGVETFCAEEEIMKFKRSISSVKDLSSTKIVTESDASSSANTVAPVKSSIENLLASKMAQTELQSPLISFHSYKLNQNFPFHLIRHPAVSNKIDPVRPLCPFQLHGRCADTKCPWQHDWDYQVTDVEIVCGFLGVHSSLCPSGLSHQAYAKKLLATYSVEDVARFLASKVSEDSLSDKKLLSVSNGERKTQMSKKTVKQLDGREIEYYSILPHFRDFREEVSDASIDF